MNDDKTFKTKTGYCHILPDRIVLTRDGIIGNATQLATGSNVSRIVLIYGGLAIWLFYIAFENYQNGLVALALLFGFMGIFIFYGLLRSLNNSATPIILREKIKEVKLKKGTAGLTRSRFEILFEDDKGKVKKRLIMLPGSLNDGQNETEKAINIMIDEKLMTNQ